MRSDARKRTDGRKVFLAVDYHNNPLICWEQYEDDPAPKVILERTDANAEGFDLLADLIPDWRCEDWR